MCLYDSQELTVWPTQGISCVLSPGTRIAKWPRVTPSSTSTKGSCLPANRCVFFSFLFFFLVTFQRPVNVFVSTPPGAIWQRPAHMAHLPYFPISVCVCLGKHHWTATMTNRKLSKWSIWSISRSCRLNCHSWWFNIGALSVIPSAGFRLGSLMSLNHS